MTRKSWKSVAFKICIISFIGNFVVATAASKPPNHDQSESETQHLPAPGLDVNHDFLHSNQDENNFTANFVGSYFFPRPYAIKLPPPQDISELALLLPDFFRFIENVLTSKNPYINYYYPNPCGNWVPGPPPPSHFGVNKYRTSPYSSPVDYPQEENTQNGNIFPTEGWPNPSFFYVYPQLFPSFHHYYPEVYTTNPEISDAISSRTEDHGKESHIIEPSIPDPKLKHLKAVPNMNKYCVFQGISPLPDPRECKKYLICFPTMFNRFEAYVSECPRDKTFSAIYRRCVQHYLVPECSGMHSNQWYVRPKTRPQLPKVSKGHANTKEIEALKNFEGNGKPLNRPIKNANLHNKGTFTHGLNFPYTDGENHEGSTIATKKAIEVDVKSLSNKTGARVTGNQTETSSTSYPTDPVDITDYTFKPTPTTIPPTYTTTSNPQHVPPIAQLIEMPYTTTMKSIESTDTTINAVTYETLLTEQKSIDVETPSTKNETQAQAQSSSMLSYSKEIDDYGWNDQEIEPVGETIKKTPYTFPPE